MEEYTKHPDKYYVKNNVSKHEYNMQKHVYDLGIVNVPKILSYCAQTQRMAMNRVGKMSISDMYGEDAKLVPDDIFKTISSIIQLLIKHNIVYPDLTGYNFVEDTNGEIWIIDFEHASLNEHINSILSVCSGNKIWNANFA
jgi:tRNA A-37 threonylcarbamoyl transferase component Bud32